MNGSIWVEAELGKGSTFAFRFHALHGTSEKNESLLAPGVNWDNMRVLVVDDSWEIREYFKDIAERIGIACDVAAGGIEACKYIEETGPYDIYFIDLKMPGMNGIELSLRINEHGINKSVIIIISATDWNLIEDEAREVGVNKFLQKPLFASAVADCINQCLGIESDILGKGEKQDVTNCFADYKLLLVEDVEINREILISVLEPTALEIVCAENGVEAVEMFGAAPDDFDMIFMDIHMPEMDGYEATRHIRAMEFEHAKEIPIVAMTANVFREDVEKCLAAGMNDHIGKPLSFDEVMEKLRQYLPNKQRQTQTQAQLGLSS